MMKPGMSDGEIVLAIDDLEVEYTARRGLVDLLHGRGPARLRAVDGVSLEIRRNEVMGLVGESGCGKTTLGRAILRIVPPTRGRILFEGQDLLALDVEALRLVRRRLQMVFQDPFSSLNPRMSVEQTLAEVLRFHRMCSEPQLPARVRELLGLVGLGPELGKVCISSDFEVEGSR